MNSNITMNMTGQALASNKFFNGDLKHEIIEI